MKDIKVRELIDAEFKRQNETIELIASENYPSIETVSSMSSVFTCKYSEGYPQKRYYGGCEVVDELEQLAIDRACKLFGADHANVQPHSGSQANMCAYASVLSLGDKILAPALSSGGHLTHSSPVNFVSKLYDVHTYEVSKETLVYDYDEIEKQAMTIKPNLIIAGTSAYSRKLDFKRFQEIAHKCGAYLLVDMAHIAGLVAAGLHESPVKYADIVTSTTHKTLRGSRGGFILCKEKYAKDVDKAVFPQHQGGPLQHIIASKATCFLEADSPEFKKYIEQVLKNAKVLAETLLENGVNVITGGTDTHVLLVDLSNLDITGKEAQILLDSLHIATNKNTIPFDERSPFITSGLRIGSAAVTSRGFKEDDMRKVGQLIAKALKNKDSNLDDIKAEAKKLCEKYPLQNY